MKPIKIIIILILFTQAVNAQKIDSIPSLPTMSKRSEIQKRDIVGKAGPSLTSIEKFNFVLIPHVARGCVL